MNKTKFEILKVLVLVSARLMLAPSCRQRSQAIPMKRWNAFLKSLALDQKVDFEEGDIGLAGGAADSDFTHGIFTLALQQIDMCSSAFKRFFRHPKSFAH